MKIPRDLPQFKGEGPTLIIVAGKQNAVFYRAHEGLISRLDAFRIPVPSYSDHEGGFKKRGRGVTTKSGAVLELRDDDIIRDFLREFKRRIKYITWLDKPDFRQLFLFAPAVTKNKIQAVLPPAWRRKLKPVIPGNFYYRHPLDLLAKLQST